MMLIHGENGRGKSNLIEALYILAIAKSQRASSERELVRMKSTAQGNKTSVAAMIQRNRGSVRIQIDFESTNPNLLVSNEDSVIIRLQKNIKVNGSPRSSIELVGEMNAVMFSAQDLELVQGSPPIRRRYMDILISQLDQDYLRLLQRYQKVLAQRNHLLKTIREGKAQFQELDFWDDEIVESGKKITAKRAETVQNLSKFSELIHVELAGDSQKLEIEYLPSIDMIDEGSQDTLDKSFRNSLALNRTSDVSHGFTTRGPHRDDLRILLNNMNTRMFSSRGQCRTAVLAMKLAEAQYLKCHRGEEPILLLDDVLSELDLQRRTFLLDKVSQYQQSFITTAETGIVVNEFLSKMSKYSVNCDSVTLMNQCT